MHLGGNTSIHGLYIYTWLKVAQLLGRHGDFLTWSGFSKSAIDCGGLAGSLGTIQRCDEKQKQMQPSRTAMRG